MRDFVTSQLAVVGPALFLLVAAAGQWWRARKVGVGVDSEPERQAVWILAAAMLFVVAANLGGAVYWLSVELMVLLGEYGVFARKELEAPKLGFLYLPALALVALALWRARRVALPKTFMLGLLGALAAFGLHKIDGMIVDEAFFTAHDMHPVTGFPVRLSAAGTRKRHVALPQGVVPRELQLGVGYDSRGYERTLGCITSADGVWCFLADEAAPRVKRVFDRAVTQLTIGHMFGCGIDSAGELVCWGRTPPALAKLEGLPTQSVSLAGGWCVVTGETAKCNGGDGSRMLLTTEPLRSIDANWSDGACTLSSADNVSCHRFRLGDEPLPGDVKGVAATQLVAGFFAACAVTTDRQLACWGQDLKAALVSGLSDVVAVTLGLKHHCAIMAPGALFCWGDNRWGQLGDGTTRPLAQPTRVTVVGPVKAVAAFVSDTTCAITAEDRVVCWGRQATIPYLP